MKKIVMMAVLTAAFAGGAFADSAISQLQGTSPVKVVFVPDSQGPAIVSEGKMNCTPERAAADFLRLVKRSPVSNLKINASVAQLGTDKKKIVILASYDMTTPAFDYSKIVPMAGYAFYDAETCVIKENLFMMVHEPK